VYKLRFTNPDYPVLSFVYAIYAGGENALYCDHGGDFYQAYLIEPVVEAAKKKAYAAVDAVAGQSDAVVAAAQRTAKAQVEAATAAAQDRANQLAQIFGPLLAKRNVMASRPPAEQDPVLPTAADVKTILGFVEQELNQLNVPLLPPMPQW
jgi:hypothetical protein